MCHCEISQSKNRERKPHEMLTEIESELGGVKIKPASGLDPSLGLCGGAALQKRISWHSRKTLVEAACEASF